MCKILCCSKEAYSKLKVVVRGLGRDNQAPSPSKKIIRKRRIPVKARSRAPEKPRIAYEPTDISRTHNSSQWRWQRVKDWFEDYEELYNAGE